jgi:hypothetical protein
MEELYIEKFFSVNGEIGRNGFGLSGFNRGCWSSRDYLFIKWIVIIGEGFSKGGALGRLLLTPHFATINFTFLHFNA